MMAMTKCTRFIANQDDRVVKALDLSSNGRMSAWVRTPLLTGVVRKGTLSLECMAQLWSLVPRSKVTVSLNIRVKPVNFPINVVLK